MLQFCFWVLFVWTPESVVRILCFFPFSSFCFQLGFLCFFIFVSFSLILSYGQLLLQFSFCSLGFLWILSQTVCCFTCLKFRVCDFLCFLWTLCLLAEKLNRNHHKVFFFFKRVYSFWSFGCLRIVLVKSTMPNWFLCFS